jgi:phenylalanyl-tRNA synthetase beta subunit
VREEKRILLCIYLFIYVYLFLDPAFFPDRRVDVFVSNQKVGVLGSVHPEVLHNFEIPHPCTAFELEISLNLARWHDIHKNESKTESKKH